MQVQLGDNTQRVMTILFADLRGFTSLSESMTPPETFAFVNAFLERMGPHIARNDGFIDKYVGDAIMALFGGCATDAINAAIGMQRGLTQCNLECALANRGDIRVGIGIHTGDVILGTVGFRNRIDTSGQSSGGSAARPGAGGGTLCAHQDMLCDLPAACNDSCLCVS